MKAQIHLSLLAIFPFLAECQGQGTFQITFDGTPPQPPGSAFTVTNYFESGMSFRPLPGSYGFTRVGVGYPADPQNGTAYLRAAFTQSLMFSFTNGAFFDLVSVDLAEYSTLYQEPLVVRFVGYRYDGTIVTNHITTDGIIDGTGPLVDFQTFYFDSRFTGLDRVEIPTYGWSLDNLVVSVPEPPACQVLILAAALAALRSFKRKT